MKQYVALWLLIVKGLLLPAQLYDAQWLLGYNESVLDFRVDTIARYAIQPLMPIFLTNASICNSTGELLYYTNGIYIAGADGNQIMNGDSLNPSPYTTSQECCGLDIVQGALFIPKPDNSRLYYLFHFTNDSLSLGRPCTLYYSVIDSQGNGGMGEVVEKNIPILQHTALREGGMTACKHANGRDYWLIIGAYNTNAFYKFLITPNSIEGPFIQNIGPVFPHPYDAAYSKFSQDGSKFTTGIVAGPITVMDFDRCTGTFSSPIRIYHNASLDSVKINGCASLEFSPNGEYLYVSNSNDLTQYDLFAGNIQDSVELYTSDSSDFYGLGMLQASPLGKLYCSTWNGGLYAIHVINYPNIDGANAGFVYAGQPTLTLNSNNFPNLINYKLGALIGSGCDTLLNSIAESTILNDQLRLIPNPADKYLYVEMGMQGNYEFDLINETGQVIARKETRQVDIFDTGNLANGVYFIRVVDKATGAEIETRKVVVVH